MESHKEIYYPTSKNGQTQKPTQILIKVNFSSNI